MTENMAPEGMCDAWRERLEAGALHRSVPDRALLIEKLVVAHERYDEIAALWATEARRRMNEVQAESVEWIPAEVVLAELEAMAEEGPDDPDPPVPTTFGEIERQALYLPNDDFYLLLVNLEAALPAEVEAVWRADIQRRIAAIPGEVERRYRECNGDWEDDDDGDGEAAVAD